MNTAFFKIEKELYKKFFYNAKMMVNHSKNRDFELTYYLVLYKNNLYKYNSKINILPNRINYGDDYFQKPIYWYNVMRRKRLRYDKILLKL